MAVQKSQYGPIEIPDDISLPAYLLSAMGKHGQETAMIYAKTGAKVTYQEVCGQIRQFACSMYNKGLIKGERVMIFSPNHTLYPIVFLGTGYIGGIAALVNPHYTSGELKALIEETRPTYFFTMSTVLGVLEEAIVDYKGTKGIYLLDESPRMDSVMSLISKGSPDFTSPVNINPKEDVLVLPFSSGTTGTSKGVMLTHHNILANCNQTVHPGTSLGQMTTQTYVCFLPMYHIYALAAITCPGLLRGHVIVVIEKYELELYLQSIQKYKATLLHVIPPVVLELANNPISRRYDLSSVHSFYCGAAPLGPEMEKKVLQLTGIPNFSQGYGLTETGPNVHISPAVGAVHGSCGKLLPNTECKVVDVDTGRTLGPNEDGELLVKGPQVMKGYWNRPKATQQTMENDGFFHTGDIGHYDTAGNFYVVDRLKELIKWKGLQVAPAELEFMLLKHPAVTDAAVIGVPDDEAGEVPKAYVVLKAGEDVKAENLVKFIADNLAPHKRLRGGVEFIDVIPRSPSGKILRRFLRQRVRTSRPQAKL